MIVRETNGTKSLLKALSIIELLQDASEPMGTSEIAKAIGIHKSTVSRILASMEQGYFVERESQSRRYVLGKRFLQLAGKVFQRMDLSQVAREPLRELAMQTKRNSNLAVLSDTSLVFIRQFEIPLMLRNGAPDVRREMGDIAPVHATAIGKAVLAWLSEARVRYILATAELTGYTRKTITDPEQLIRQLAEIRMRGFAVEEGELTATTRCVAAPVFNYAEDVIGGVSVSWMSEEPIQDDLLDELARAVQACAATISEQLGSTSRAGEFRRRSASLL